MVTGNVSSGGLSLMAVPTSNGASTGGLYLLAKRGRLQWNDSWHHNKDIRWLSNAEDVRPEWARPTICGIRWRRLSRRNGLPGRRKVEQVSRRPPNRRLLAAGHLLPPLFGQPVVDSDSQGDKIAPFMMPTGPSFARWKHLWAPQCPVTAAKMRKKCGERAKAKEHWSRKPPHLLTSLEKLSGVGKELAGLWLSRYTDTGNAWEGNRQAFVNISARKPDWDVGCWSPAVPSENATPSCVPWAWFSD